MKKVIFVSGPYSADTKLGILHNIVNALTVAEKLWQKGWVAICPHGNTFLMEGEYKTYIKGNCELIRRSDALLMTKNWRKSKGAVAEHNFAKLIGKDIYYDIKDVPSIEEDRSI